MLWVAVMVIAVIALICECVEECIESRYERQDSKCECDTCPMRYECEEMRDDE